MGATGNHTLHGNTMRSQCLLLIPILALTTGCSRSPGTLTLATTSSTLETGVLDVLLPAFTEKTGISVTPLAVDKEEVLDLARSGAADVLLTCDPAAETHIEQDGLAAFRQRVMYNDFVLLGPESDPAGVKRARTIAEVFQRFSMGVAPFISMADESATHQKERALWAHAGIVPEGDWYFPTRTGTEPALLLASEHKAYILCDRASYLAFRGKVKLAVLFEGDNELKNLYSVTVVSRTRHPHVQQKAAEVFALYLRSPEGQKLISEVGVDKFDQAVFFADAQ